MEVLTVFGFYCNNNASILFSNSMCVGGEITCIVYYFFFLKYLYLMALLYLRLLYLFS